MKNKQDSNELAGILGKIKTLAKRYYQITKGRPLGVTGEVGEYEASRLLNIKLATVRQDGYDATQGKTKIQIKTRRIIKKGISGGKLGGIKTSKDWDIILLVILNENYEVSAIYKAKRSNIEKALKVPGSRARNERGQLNIKKFINIAGKKPIWPK